MKKAVLSAVLFFISFSICYAYPVPDTGQTQSYTDTFGEDSDYTCNPLSYSDLGNGIIQDNVTGLMWQQATAPGTYTWQQALDYCNNLTLGGYSDWRLPTLTELSGLVDSSIPYPGPSINTTFYPDTAASGYWSSATYAHDTSDAWGVCFNGGGTCNNDKSYGNYVRAVRGGQSTNNFTDNNDGTISDTSTGLMWQQATAPGTYTWEGAITYCENLNLAGYSDWRLPNWKELQSIVDYSRYNPAINTTYFPDTAASPDTGASCYWSSTTYAHDTSGALLVLFYNGTTDGYSSKSSYGFYVVRAMRGGQCEASSNSTTTIVPYSTTTTSTASEVNPTIAQQPMSGPPGTTFVQWGTGFTPNSTASLHVKKPDNTEYTPQTITIDTMGHFETTYKSSLDKAAGSYTWWAIDGPTGEKSNEVSYQITAGTATSTTTSTPDYYYFSITITNTPTKWFDPRSVGSAGMKITINYNIEPTEFSGLLYMTVSDSSGNVVATPVTDKAVQGGTGTVTWDASSSGADSFDQSKNPYSIKLWIENTERISPKTYHSVWVGRPVVLVHGYMSDPYGCWATMESKLKDDKFYVIKSDYAQTIKGNKANGDITRYAANLDEELINYVFRKNYGAKFDIVAHSMGGLVTRKAFQKGLNKYVDKFIMLGTPNHGSELFYRRNLVFLCPIFGDLFNLYLMPQGSSCWSVAFSEEEKHSILGQASIDMTPGSGFWQGLSDSGIGYYTIAGTTPSGFKQRLSNIVLEKYHDDYYGGISQDGGINDGWVRVLSVRMPGAEPTTFSYNHSDLHDEDKVYEEVKSILQTGKGLKKKQKYARGIATATEDIAATYSEGSSFEGTLAPGKTTKQTLPISASEEVTFLFTASAEGTEFTATSPSGEKYDSTSSEYMIEGNVQAFTIANPEQGQWLIEVKAPATAGEDVHYSILTTLKTTTTLNAALPSQSYYSGEEPVLRAVLKNGASPITGATVQAVIVTPDNETFTVQLYDDGKHSDNGTADGVYGAVFTEGGTVGLYEVVFKASGTAGGTAFVREAASNYWIHMFRDLSVAESDISFSNNYPADNETITIKTVIHNAGEVDADNASILFYDGEPVDDKLIKKVNTKIVSGKTAQVEASWQIDNATHDIYVQIDPFSNFQESDYTNNRAYKTIPISSDNTDNNTTTTTTTTTAPAACTLEKVLENGHESDLGLFRQYRDQQLTKTSLGAKLVSIYYAHSAEATGILVTHPNLLKEASRLTLEMIPVIQSALKHRGNVYLTTAQQKNIVSLMMAIQQHASWRLRKDIKYVVDIFEGGEILKEEIISID